MGLTLWWDYRCHACNETGSCPVPADAPMMDAVAIVRNAHAGFNRQCDREEEGGEIRIFHVSEQE